jgi:P pilus assembly protein, pilin FimA
MAGFGANAADQGSGKVTFTGQIIDAPCSINPQDVEQEVKLGSIAIGALKSSGKSTHRNSRFVWKTVPCPVLQEPMLLLIL